MKRGWRTLVVLAGLSLCGYIVHALVARALIDHGVAGALLAGGGGWGTVAAAAGFLVLRLACFVGVAAVPAVEVWWWAQHRGPRKRSPL